MNRAERRACAKRGHAFKHSENGHIFCADCGAVLQAPRDEAAP